MGKNNKGNPNGEFRKESKKNENKMFLILGLAAVVLGIIIVLTQKIDFSELINEAEQVEETIANDEAVEGTEALTEENEGSVEEIGTVDEGTVNDTVETEAINEDAGNNTEDTGAIDEGTVNDTVETVYKFRNKKLLNQHYEKHGKEMGFDSAESYEQAASAVINNPEALNKIEAEDGDFVYYVEATNEFVILSTDGYIRTYFLPSGGLDYYNRQ